MLLKLMRDHLRGQRSALTLILLLQFVSMLGVLLIPALNADIINNGVLKGNTGYILRLGGVMLGVAVVQLAATVGSVYYGARTALAMGRDIRDAVFVQVQRFSAREMGRFGTASLITRTTNDVQQVQMVALLGLTMMVTAPLICVAGTILALRQSVPLSGILVFSLPTMAVMFWLIIRRMRPLFRKLQGRVDEANRRLRGQIAGVRVIRAFVRDSSERSAFAATNTALRSLGISVGWLIAMMYPLVLLLVNISTVAVLWFGGRLAGHGSLSVGSLSAFMSYLAMILGTTMLATFMFMMAPRAEVCADRIQEILNTETSVLPPEHPVRAMPDAGRLELTGVEFGYPGAEATVLSGIDLTVRAGEFVGVVGSTGSGKTTLLNLLPRLADATAGNVLVGGVDVRELDRASLSKAIGMVPQRPFLFSGTIASNLRYSASDATDEELWHALEIAQAREFVAALPDGLDTEVAQGGTNLSGGQRQRIAIARVLVRRPDIYLFDDSFSALDYATEAALRAALAVETAGATIVVVAQRVTSIRDADRIVVLNEGRIAGIGTHGGLMDDNEIYQEIVLSQLTEREAA